MFWKPHSGTLVLEGEGPQALDGQRYCSLGRTSAEEELEQGLL